MNMNNYNITNILIITFICILFGYSFYLIIRKKNHKHSSIELMNGYDFEHYCAKLLAKNGFQDIEVTKGSGDYGIDILAEKEGITYAIQCKRYESPVGVKAIQEAYTGRDFYDRMVGAVMTNQYFTGPAVETAKKLHILLWDGGYIEEMDD